MLAKFGRFLARSQNFAKCSQNVRGQKCHFLPLNALIIKYTFLFSQMLAALAVKSASYELKKNIGALSLKK